MHIIVIEVLAAVHLSTCLVDTARKFVEMLWMNIKTFSILTKQSGEGENCAHDKELSFILYLGIAIQNKQEW